MLILKETKTLQAGTARLIFLFKILLLSPHSPTLLGLS
jgi:hypothetical protein